MVNLKKLASLMILVLLTSTLSGCWDRRELEELAFVLTIGVDQGTQGRYLWTFQIAIPRQLAGGQSGGGGGGDGKSSTTTISVESTTIFDALNLLNSFVGRKANLMHAKAIIISEAVARRDPVPLRTFGRYREIRRDLFVMIAEGKAKDIITSLKPVLEQNPAKFIETLVLNASFTGLMPKTQLHDYLTNMESRALEATAILVGKTGGLSQPKKVSPNVSAPYFPGEIPREGGSPAEIIGVAVFNGARMVGKLNGTENRIMAMLTGHFKRGFITFSDPLASGKNIAMDVRPGRPPVTQLQFKGNIPLITVHLNLEADILAIQSLVNYTRPEMIKKLEKIAENEIRKNVIEVIKKTQNMSADIFGFGIKAQCMMQTYSQWENLPWHDLYPNAEVHVTVHVNIRRIGIQYSPAIPTL
ncbi:MAG: Ger(x)C family spore germination protein [Thermincolia bacterium]